MQQRQPMDQAFTNRVLLNGQLATPKWWLPTVLTLGAIVIGGWVMIGFMLNKGLGVTGLNRPVFWGVFIVTFVFWVGISHAGIMISAILRLTQAEWRRPVTRTAELLTVCSLLTALLFPAMQDGRVWRDYWMTPMDFARGIWPNARSPLIWDPFAIGTYLSGAIMFLYVALLPDLGNLRDRTYGKMHMFYSVVSLGWRGNPRQWKLQTIGGILLSALMLPIFVSVHSVVSWDFAITTGVEGWHSTIFAPYFVIGAVHSGVSAVVTVMALMRWLWKWDAFIRPEHFDALARLLIVVATAWLGFTFLELVFAVYSQEGQEVALRELQIFTWPWNMMFIVFMLTGYFIPVGMWLFKSVRNNIALMFWTSILVNVGMWLERYFIVVGGLSRKTPLVFSWDTYRPAAYEWAIMGWSFAWVTFLLLLFSRFFPLVPLFEQKESQTFSAELKIGRARVPAVLREQE